jgi:hypothetical protein
MPRFWLVMVSLVIAALGSAITIQGFISGGWMWGLVFGIGLPVIALYEWLTLREVDPKLAADRTVIALMFAMLGLAMDALDLVPAYFMGE